ncbi:MAG: phosphatidate cytidylyltransferase [Bacteroidetes bacterium HGW-Bacteroidetes-17]|nr:MAG: phosphatidate cytidylyltransferase [Bacteroidetes bacterium HGW-Bacteroidetes-17]
MKNLVTRSLTGIVFVIVVIGSVMLGSMTFSAFMLMLSMIGLTEYIKLRPNTFDNISDKICILISGISLFLIVFLVQTELLKIEFLNLIFLIFLIIVIRTLILSSKEAIAKISEFVFGLAYVVLPFVLMTGFYQSDTPTKLPELLIGFFIILWFNDVFAYIVGSLIGKTKLYEKISPKKTWEGTIGGTILSVLSAYLLSTIFLSLNLTNWLVIGFLISIFATLGDLTESMFKRQANVKDSGNIMPGHGGILDRFDGLLLAAPAIYVYLTFIS